MRTITASNARQGFAELLESLDQGPVLIERQRRGVAVVMSVNEYWRLRQADSASQAWAPDQTVTRHAGSTWILEEAEGPLGPAMERRTRALRLVTAWRTTLLSLRPGNGQAGNGRWVRSRGS